MRRTGAAQDPSDPPRDREEDLNYIFMGTLREIREELQNIRLSLAKIKEAGTDVREEEREKKIQTAWDENQVIIDHNKAQISDLLRKFPDQIYKKDPGGPGIYDRYCDDVTRIDNQWERFTRLWTKYSSTGTPIASGTTGTAVTPGTPGTGTPVTPDTSWKEIQGHIDDLEKILCEMILGINLLTIPDRVNEHFETMYPGQELDFEQNFGNELCTKDHARPILEFINAHPECVTGIVDAAKGKIYKVDPSWERKAVSFLVAGIVCITGFILAFLLPGFLSMAKYPLSITVPDMTIANTTVTSIDFASADPATLNVTAYFLCACLLIVIVGGLTHLLIGGVKQMKSAEAGSLLALEGWLRWFHIKELQNWAAVVSLVLGFLGMVFILKTADYATAFLIGYSIDSFVDLFLTRFDVTITTKTGELKKKVPQESAEATT